MFNIKTFKERKQFMKELQPIYYSSSFNNTKLTASFISKYLFKHLEGIISNHNIHVDVSECMISNLMIDLLGNAPKSKKKIKRECYPVIFDNTEYKMRMYYGGAISISEKYATYIYRECKFSDGDSYTFIFNCIIRLSSELEYPNKFSEYEDFPEHLLATYNILCYYFEQTGNYNKIKEICIILFLITQKYIEKIDLIP